MSVWEFTISNIGYKFIISGSEGARVCAGVGVYEKGFCVESFTLSGMGDKLPNYADKSLIGAIDGAVDKEERLPTRS